MDADSLTAAGLGLGHDSLFLARATAAWLAAGSALRDRTSAQLASVDPSVAVETIGSSAVLGMLAKPIVDLAVGLPVDRALTPIAAELVATGWIFRGDAGDDGGHVFVLEARPWHRVAHLHVVDLGGAQWTRYLRLRDLLRADPAARHRYERVKRRLAAQHGDDRAAYTVGKTDVIAGLLANTD